MAKKNPGTSSGPLKIKGTRGDDTIKIGQGKYAGLDETSGFIIDGWHGDDFLQGGSGVDQIFGGAGFDVIVAQPEDIFGAAGSVAYDGGLDLDILDFSAWATGIGIDLGSTNTAGDSDRFYLDLQLTPNGTVQPEITWSGQLRGVTTSIEGVIGGSGNDYIIGDWGPSYIDGGPGDDYINGGYGFDRLIGGLGDDLIFFGNGDKIVTGDAPGSPADHGNDIFMPGGGVSGSYFFATITDFDSRIGSSDLQFDLIVFNPDMQLSWDEDANGNLRVIYDTFYTEPLGQVVFEGLTLADYNAGYVSVGTYDPMSGGITTVPMPG